MIKKGILGGTFNPIHNGHLKIAEEAYEAFGLESVFIIPSGISYFKADQKIPEGKIRYDMCLLACKDKQYLKVSDIEIKRPGNSYTYETLRALRENEPDTVFYYILGADSLSELKDFKNPDEIVDNCRIAVSVRGNEDNTGLEDLIKMYKERFHADISVFNTVNIDISSTEIRKCVKDGEDISGLVPKAVAKYIYENGLYHN